MGFKEFNDAYNAAVNSGASSEAASSAAWAADAASSTPRGANTTNDAGGGTQPAAKPSWKDAAQRGRGGTPSGARQRWLDNQQGRQWGNAWARAYFEQNGLKWDDRMSSNHEGVTDIYGYASKERDYTTGLLKTMNAQLEALNRELQEAKAHGQDAAMSGYIIDPLSASLYGDVEPYEGRSETEILRDIQRLEGQIRYTQVQLGAANSFIDTWDDNKAGDEAFAASGLSREDWYQQSKSAAETAEQELKAAEKALEDYQFAAGTNFDRQGGAYTQQQKDMIARLEGDVAAARERQQEAQRTLRWSEQRRFDELIADPANAERGKANFEVYEQGWRADKSTAQQAAKTSGYGMTPDPMAAGIAALMQELVYDKSYLGPDERWTEEQRQLFFSLWNNGTEEEIARAQDYARKVNAFYTNEGNEQMRQKVAASASSGFWAGLGHTAGSVVTGLMSGAEFMMDAAELAVRGEVTEKPFGLSDYSTAVQGAVTMTLNDKYGDWAGDAYGIATSIAQSWAAMAISGGSSGMVTAMFFGMAAKSEFDRQIAMGRPPEKAIAMGVGSGIAEALGEALSIENLKVIMRGRGTSMMLDILRSAAIEGSEEGMTTLLNTFADAIVNGDESDYHAALAGYVSQGMSYEEAARMATKDWLNGLASDIFAGAVSGGVSGGIIGPGVRSVQGASTKFSGDSQSLIAKGMEYEGSKAATLAARYGAQLEGRGTKAEGKDARLAEEITRWERLKERGTVNDRRIADREIARLQARQSRNIARAEGLSVRQADKLSREISKVSNEQNADKIRGSITRQLTGAGLNRETAELAASGIWKSANGKLMTKEESRAMRTNRLGVQLRDELREVVTEGAVDVERITEDSPEWLRQTALTDSAMELMEAAYPEQMQQVQSALNNVMQQGELAELAAGQGEHADAIVQMFDPKTQNALDYVTAMDTAMNIEAANVSDRAAWEKSESVQYLTEQQRDYAWEQGQKQRRATQEKAQSRQREIDSRKEKAPQNAKKPAQKKDGKQGKKSGKVRSQGVEIEGKKYKAGDLKKISRAERRVLDRLSTATGVDIVFFETEAGESGRFEGANGFYRDGVVYLDINAGADNVHQQSAVLLTAAHEFTHFIRENSPAQYEALKEFVTERMLSDGREFAAMVRGKMNQIVDGKKLSREDAVEEVIADACEMVFSDSKSTEALRKKDEGLWTALKNWMHDFLSDIREAFTGVEARHESAKAMNDYLSELAERFGVALAEASENAGVRDASGTTKYSFEGYADDGRGKYKADYPKGTPKKAKAQDILRYIQTVWSKKPIRLRIWEEGQSPRYIEAAFDPTYDESGNAYSDATKLMGGNRHGSAAEQRVTLDLASDYYKIASEAVYNYSKAEEGKTTEAHKDVKKWHYFINGIYFAEQNSDTYEPYTVTINVKEKTDGTFVYSFSAEKERRLATPGTLHAPVKGSVSAAPNSKPSDIKISQQEPGVKTKLSMRDNEGNTLSEGQQRYFAESKVRDEKGNLMVVYRGGSGEHTVFDRRKSKPSNLYGRGFYFTSSKSHAQQYGNATEYYLDIKHPLGTDSHEITRAQLRKLLEYIENDGEDYDLYNYGENATAESVLRSVWSKSKSDFQMIQDINATVFGDLVAATELFNQINGTDFDGFILPTETVTFRSEQAKRIDNQNPTDNPDINFSRRDSTEGLTKEEAKEQARAYTKMKARAAKLEKQVKELKRELSKKPGKRVRPEDVRKLARELVQDYGSKANADKVAELLQELGNRFVSGEELYWDDLMELAQSAAYEVLFDAVAYEDSREAYGDADGIAKDIRGRRFKLSESELKGLPEGFRKMYSGKLHMGTKEGTSVDAAYAELQESHGKGLFPDTLAAEDMMAVIADVYDRVTAKPTAYNPFQRNMNEAVNHVALDIMDTMLSEDIRQSPQTAMEKAEAKLQEEKRKRREALDKQKRDSEARIRDIRQQEKARRQEAVNRERAKKWEKVQTLRDYYRAKEEIASAKRKESAAVKKYRARVYEHADTLMRWINNNSQKEHVPESLKEPLIELLNEIDFRSKSNVEKGVNTRADQKYRDALSRLNTVLQNQRQWQRGEGGQAETNGFLDLPDDIFQAIAQHTETVRLAFEDSKLLDLSDPVSMMNSGQLQDLALILGTLETSIRQINQYHTASRFADVEAAARESMQDMRELGAAASVSRAADKAGDIAFWRNATPYYAFKRFGVAGMERFKKVMDGWGKMAMNIREVIAFTERTYNAKEVKNWEETVKTIELSSGRKVQMTVAQMMGLYCLSKREQGRLHLFAGGMRIADIDSKGRVIKQVESAQLTPSDVAEITDRLTERQRAVADKLQEFMVGRCADWANEVSMARFGYRQADDPNYYPIDTDPNSRPLNDPKAKETDLFRLINMASMKSVNPNANNAAVIHSIFDVFAAHASDMAKYNALALPLIDMMKWYNFRERSSVEVEDGGETITQLKDNSVQQAIELAFGKQAQSYFMNFMKDMNGIREGGRNEQVLKGLVGKYKAAAVGANIRVALQQPTAIIRAAYMINAKYLTQGAAMSGGVKEALKYSGLAVWKDLGFFDVNINRGMRDLAKGSATLGDRVRETGMKLAEWCDKITWGAIWNAAKLEIMEKNPGLQGEELMQATASRFDDIIIATQVMDSTITRSELMRSGNLTMAELTSFMSEPTVTYNVLMDAAMDYHLEKRRSGSAAKALKKTGGQMSRALSVFVVGAAVTSLAAAIADAMRDDDEYETFMEQWLEHTWENFKDNVNPFGLIPIGRDVWDITISLLKTGKVSAPTSMMWEPFVNIGKGLSSAWDAYHLLLDPEAEVREPNRTQWGRLYNALQGLSSITGLPAAGFLREVKALWNVSGAVITGKTLKFYDIGEKATIRTAVQEGKLSEDEAIEKLIAAGEFDNGDDAYWQVQAWLNADVEGWNKMYDLHAAIAKGDKAAWEKAAEVLTDHGYSMHQLRNETVNQVGRLVCDESGQKLSRAKAKDILKTMGGMTQMEADHQWDEWQMKLSTGIYLKDLQDEFVAGNVGEARAVQWLIKYDHQRKLDAEAKVQEWKMEKETGISYNRLRDAYLHGEISRDKVVSYLQRYGGKTAEEAEAKALHFDAAIKYGVQMGSSEYGILDAYLEGYLTREVAKEIMIFFDGKTEEEAEEYMSQYDFEKETGYAWKSGDGVQTAYENGEIDWQEGVEWFMKAHPSTHGSPEVAEELMQVVDWKINVPGADKINRDAVQYWEKRGYHVTNRGMGKADFAFAWKLYMNSESQYDANGVKVKEKAQVFFDKLYQLYQSGDYTLEEINGLSRAVYGKRYINLYRKW